MAMSLWGKTSSVSGIALKVTEATGMLTLAHRLREADENGFEQRTSCEGRATILRRLL